VCGGSISSSIGLFLSRVGYNGATLPERQTAATQMAAESIAPKAAGMKQASNKTPRTTASGGADAASMALPMRGAATMQSSGANQWARGLNDAQFQRLVTCRSLVQLEISVVWRFQADQ